MSLLYYCLFPMSASFSVNQCHCHFNSNYIFLFSSISYCRFQYFCHFLKKVSFSFPKSASFMSYFPIIFWFYVVYQFLLCVKIIVVLSAQLSFFLTSSVLYLCRFYLIFYSYYVVFLYFHLQYSFFFFSLHYHVFL